MIERVTRMLNMASAVIMIATGVYVHSVFNSVLSMAAVSVVWTGIVLYAVMQIEFGYNLMKKWL